MRTPIASFVVLVAACGGGSARSSGPTPIPATPAPPASAELRPPEAFAGITDRAERSRALFLETAKVYLHPRCVNCHPADDSPRQGELGALHDPPVSRGADDHGVPAMRCGSCHQDANLELARVPGAPAWHLAPRQMAWQGRSAAAICEQIKDPARNGGKTLAQLVEHNARDPLVAWGWEPGANRTPAPGSQAIFGALSAEWVATGAECPSEEVSR